MNQGYTYSESINDRGAGQAVAHYLGTRYPHTDLAGWRAHILAGRILVDGEPTSADSLLRLGQTLAWHRPPWEEPKAPLECPVLYHQGGVLVVHKPAGLPTMPGGGFLEHTLVHQLRLIHPKASPLHRLGRWTSGAVLCGCNPTVRAHLTAQFVAKTVRKRYRTLASGQVNGPLDIDVPIGPVPYGPLGTVHAASATGRPASTQVSVVERREDATLCAVAIATGRPHQIRIHLAAAGHPLVGDPLYGLGGMPPAGSSAVPGDPGYALHAAEIGFRHPETDAWVQVQAPLPDWAHSS